MFLYCACCCTFRSDKIYVKINKDVESMRNFNVVTEHMNNCIWSCDYT